MRTWGLVLSGGIACGIANGGFLEVLDREGLRPGSVAGSSMGAIIGALYAFGIPVAKIHALAQELTLLNVASISEAPLKGGLHGGLLRARIAERLHPLVGNARIGDCRIPFVCVAGRMREPVHWHQDLLGRGFLAHVQERVEKHVFGPDVRILDAILASSAIPVVFSPAEVEGDAYIDLLAFGSIPARTLRELHHPEIVIATNTNPGLRGFVKVLPSGWREFVEASYVSLQESRDACDLVIEPEMPFGPLRFDKAEDFWKAGKDASEKNIEVIKKLLL